MEPLDFVEPNFTDWIKDLPVHTSGLVQVRSEVTGLYNYPTLQAALDAVKADPTIWKISYSTEDGWRRITVPDNRN